METHFENDDFAKVFKRFRLEEVLDNIANWIDFVLWGNYDSENMII